MQVVAVADQSGPTTPKTEKGETGTEGLDHQRSGGIRGAFDSRAVASATLDVMEFILSGEGQRVRVLLVKDIVRTCSTVLGTYYLDAMKLEKEAFYSESYGGDSSKAESSKQQKAPGGMPSWKDIASSVYGDSVFANPISWSKARLLRLWAGRQGMWSSNRKDTETASSGGDSRSEKGGQRGHSQYGPRTLNLGPLNAEKTYRFRSEKGEATVKVNDHVHFLRSVSYMFT